MSAKLREAFFAFDGGPAFLGFTYGQLWNGWGSPMVEKDTFRRWCEAYADYDEAAAFRVFPWDPDEVWHLEDSGQWHLMTPLTATCDGKDYEVLDVAMAMCWHQTYPEDALDQHPIEMQQIRDAFVPSGFDVDKMIGYRENKILTKYHMPEERITVTAESLRINAQDYVIELDRIPDTRALLEWVHHLTEKSWVDNMLIRELIEKVFAAKGWDLYLSV